MSTLTKKYHLDLLLLGTGIFFFYLACLPHAVTLEDDGLFLLAAYFHGIAHPPGYPLHSLLGYLFVHLPFGNPALNGHALSAFFSALSSVLIFLITALLTANNPLAKWTPYIAALAFTLSETVWSQSIITEVYTLNAFLFLCVLYIALYIDRSITAINTASPQHSGKIVLKAQPKLKWALFYLGLFSGLALANHWPLFLLGSLGIIFILAKNYKFLIQSSYLWISGLLIGLTPYLWLYINSNSHPFIQYYGPLENISDLYGFISRKYFNQLIDFSATATLTDKIELFGFVLKQLVNQWGMFNSIFVPLGLLVAFSQYKNQKINLLGLLISYLSASLILALILGYDFDLETQTNMPPFLVMADALGAIFFAIGVTYSLNKVQQFSIKDFKWIVVALILIQALAANFFINYRANYNWTSRYAKQLLDSLEPNSTLFVSGDINTGVLGYWRYIKGYRPDITLIQDDGLVFFATNLFNPIKIAPEEKEKIIYKYIKSTTRPVYFSYRKFRFGVDNLWLVYKYNKDVPDNEQTLQSMSKSNQDYLNFIFSDKTYTDTWTRDHRDYLRLAAISYLMHQLSESKNKANNAVIIKYIFKVAHNLQGATVILGFAYTLDVFDLIRPKDELIKLAWSFYDKEENKATKSTFLNLLAKISVESADMQQGYKYYIQSIQVWKSRENSAYQRISELIKNGKIILKK